MNRRQFAYAAIGGAILAVPARGVTIPQPAGDLAIALPDGRTERLSKYKGRPVVVALILST